MSARGFCSYCKILFCSIEFEVMLYTTKKAPLLCYDMAKIAPHLESCTGLQMIPKLALKRSADRIWSP